MLQAGSPVSDAFLVLGCSDLRSAVEYVRAIPYGRISNREDYSRVLTENRGTCSSKHALLAKLCQEQSIQAQLMLGIFRMTGRNTPKVAKVLQSYGLESIPEAHCYLKIEGTIIDVTLPGKNDLSWSHDLIVEEEIQPSQIGEFKVQRHREFLDERMWKIREECIAALSKKCIYVVGSFKDIDFSRRVVAQIESRGQTALISNPGDPRGIDGCLARIDTADVVYVSNPRGDVGKSVSVDLGYALAKGKPVYSLRPVTDPPLSHWIKVVEDVQSL